VTRWKSTDDRAYFIAYDKKYTRKARLTSVDFVYQKQGFGFDLIVRHYRKHYLPDLAYLSLDVGCNMLSGKQGPMLLWIEKHSGKDYTKQIAPEPDDFYKFYIPKDFFDRLATTVKRASDNDNAVMAKEAELRRRKRQPE
jgi:hypothetical protein